VVLGKQLQKKDTGCHQRQGNIQDVLDIIKEGIIWTQKVDNVVLCYQEIF